MADCWLPNKVLRAAVATVQVESQQGDVSFTPFHVLKDFSSKGKGYTVWCRENTVITAATDKYTMEILG